MSSKGRIKATFELDENGKPKFIQGKNLRHYKIRLAMEDVPEPVDSVTFKLHESFRNPVREVFRKGGGEAPFKETINSYGDFEISVSPSGVSEAVSSQYPREISLRLSDALRESASALGGDDDAIDEAIMDIRAH